MIPVSTHYCLVLHSMWTQTLCWNMNWGDSDRMGIVSIHLLPCSTIMVAACDIADALKTFCVLLFSRSFQNWRIMFFVFVVLTEDCYLSPTHWPLVHNSSSFLLLGEEPPACIPCDEFLTIEHILLFWLDLIIQSKRVAFYSLVIEDVVRRPLIIWRSTFLF